MKKSKFARIFTLVKFLIISFKAHLVQIIVQILRAKNFGDSDELVVIVVAVKEGLFAKDHRRKHASKRPHVQRVIVKLKNK